MFLLWWCSFKIWKRKRAGVQFISTNHLSLVSPPVRIRLTISLNSKYNKHYRVAVQTMLIEVVTLWILRSKKTRLTVVFTQNVIIDVKKFQFLGNSICCFLLLPRFFLECRWQRSDSVVLWLFWKHSLKTIVRFMFLDPSQRLFSQHRRQIRLGKAACSWIQRLQMNSSAVFLGWWTLFRFHFRTIWDHIFLPIIY